MHINMMKRIKTLVSPTNVFFMQNYHKIHIFKGLSKKTVREVSFHCYTSKILYG
jgi:hypothetical protein